MEAISINGKVLSVGDIVDFKSDVEQSGKIVDIDENCMDVALVTVVPVDGNFSGDYIARCSSHELAAKSCYKR